MSTIYIHLNKRKFTKDILKRHTQKTYSRGTHRKILQRHNSRVILKRNTQDTKRGTCTSKKIFKRQIYLKGIVKGRVEC